MQDEGIFTWLGNALGELLRTVVDAISFVMGKMGAAIQEFFTGVSSAMGIDSSLINILLIIIGVWMLFAAIRAFSRRAIFAGVIWLFLVTALFGVLMSGSASASTPAPLHVGKHGEVTRIHRLPSDVLPVAPGVPHASGAAHRHPASSSGTDRAARHGQ